ncbi:golgin subfamily A member 2 isoform X2 [Neodiprion pinetum]|uniref:golgin subfamily A member 2 isoform X2 n=1 Tax=Neodiprion pinetum TaxID=441929 RepID=UPI001EDEF195|nr:golgin subfamily A member 2-like isoform X2 [Neodiprion pinetum]
MKKSEKLLAARKRLKEFQMSKRSHMADDTSKDVNENTEESTPSQIDNTFYNSDNNYNYRKIGSPIKETQTPSIDSQVSEAPQQTSESHDFLEFNSNGDITSAATKLVNSSNPTSVFQDTVDFTVQEKLSEGSSIISNFTNMTDDVSNKHQINDNLINVENYFTSQNIMNKTDEIDLEQDILLKNETHNVNAHAESTNNRSGLHTEYESLVGSQALQKEYLLQMTSAVTNILSSDMESKDVPQELTSDLEQRNQFLAFCLQEQKELVNRLHLEVSQYRTRVSELEMIMTTKDTEFEAKLYHELNPLKEQLQLHAQTTGILVGEKAELTAALVQSQTTTKQKIAEVEELNGKLKSVQLQVSDLERELNSVKNSSEDVGKVNNQLQSSFYSLEAKYSQVKQEKDDLELETAELRQKLNVKNTELTNIQQELKEKTALLSLNELRIQQLQMTSTTQETQGISEQHHVVAALEQQLSQLMETLKAVSSERDEASNHYQNYVQQLNNQVTTLALKLEQTTKENAEISSREHSLIQRLSDLERQIQSQKEIPESTPPVINDNKERIDELVKNIDQLTLERDSLRATLHEKDSDIDALKQEMEELQEMRASNAEASRLVSALEGERLAAARAVSQNQQLKQQLSEMQDAFVQLSNTKLDLTEQLQGERSIGRKLNARLNDTENEVQKLKDEMQEKDLLMAELEKEKLHMAQIADQMQHYQAQSNQASTLQQELHNAQERIEVLMKENQQLISELNAGTMLNDSTVQNQNIIQLNGECNLQALNDVEKLKLSTATTQTDNESYSIGDTAPPISEQQAMMSVSPEAVKKLEERFKHTMERVAELSDEKQRLEHLVLQLQSETETIGEYVTLYQKQRGVLQERAKEKEEAFRQLTEQRNTQQEQLHKLKMLVAELIKEKTTSTTTSALSDSTNDGLEASKHVENKTSCQSEVVAVKDKTTSQILDLLTEIKECKDTCALEPNFHPCPWCSGNLITI